MARHILTVEDESMLRRTLSFNLEQAGYRVSAVPTAEDALDILQQDPPDLILLDIGLPGMDGLEAIQEFKQRVKVPVIFLTARDRRIDEVLGFELSGDDYVTKPFDLTVLLARVKAVLRRSQQYQEKSRDVKLLEVGDLTIDVGAHVVMQLGEKMALSPKEFDLLHALALRAGKVVTVNELLVQVWGPDYLRESQVIYVHIRWLRKKLETDPNKPERIVTMRGKGYKLMPQPA